MFKSGLPLDLMQEKMQKVRQIQSNQITEFFLLKYGEFFTIGKIITGNPNHMKGEQEKMPRSEKRTNSSDIKLEQYRRIVKGDEGETEADKLEWTVDS